LSAASSFSERLLAWFDVHGRHDLPWQKHITTYRVWISEVMLQQTQVATVIPYYSRWMARFPDVKSLAAASLDDVLHLWTGLGYYARARNLHACANSIVEQHGGEFPRELQSVMALPGIGRSTAGAILSIATGQRFPILDGNVKRVLARVFGIDGDPASAAVLDQFWTQAERCTPDARTAAYTQAIMDLGATLCMRSRPACTVCPINKDCIAAREGRQGELPSPKKKRAKAMREATLLIATQGLKNGRAVYVERRSSNGIWGGLFCPPQFPSPEAALDWARAHLGAGDGALEALPAIHHGFTHFDLKLHPLMIECAPLAAVNEAEALWYTLDAPPTLGLPQPIKALFERLRASALVACAE
jgi:A/G-specific adenine glycosylase